MLKLKNALERIFVGVVVVLMVSIVVEISLIGKNITFSSRFTPPSTEKSLKEESYYAEVQMLILLLSSILLVLLPLLAYSIFLKSKRYFFPLWVGFMVVTAAALLSNVYYMTGSRAYRSYLNQVSNIVVDTPGYC
jgi:formate hydrogenlyase subunit 3/multisubunit Na+/H+ antiporter MnhD subunit